MRLRRVNRATVRSAVGVALVAALMIGGAVAVAAAPSQTEGVIADFEGEPLNLAEGWGEAQACLIWQQAGIAECFRSEAEMDLRIDALDAAAPASSPGGIVAAASTCSSYLRLYDGTGYGSPVLYLRDRGLWQNLSSYGFDQRASSYKVGACSSYFADYTIGGGAWYPTYLTQAYDQASSMISGWDNDVSSVYIT